MINTQILGRLIKDPIAEKNKSGNTFTKFTITTNSGVNKKPLFVTVHAYGKVGEDILKYFDKGVQILVVGSVYDYGATVGDDDLAHFHFIMRKNTLNPLPQTSKI